MSEKECVGILCRDPSLKGYLTLRNVQSGDPNVSVTVVCFLGIWDELALNA